MSLPTAVTVPLDEAQSLALTALQRIGYTDNEAAIIADQVIDSELHNRSSDGLTRIISISNSTGHMNQPRRDMQITHETDVSAQIAGNDTVGYLVAHEATAMAFQKAKAKGFAVVGASRTSYSGLLSYHVDMIVREGFFCIIAADKAICMGCPSWQEPIIWQNGESDTTNDQIRSAQRRDTPVPERSDSDQPEQPTQGSDKAFRSADASWNGLAMMIQLMGALAGGSADHISLNSSQTEGADSRLLMIVIDPQLFQPWHVFLNQVDSIARGAKDTKPMNGQNTSGMASNSAQDCRHETIARDTLEVDPAVIHLLEQIGIQPFPPPLYQRRYTG